MSAEPDPYEILEVRPDASDEVIRGAYRALARRHHPDSSHDGASVARMVWVNWAWEILGNPERRSRHDREHGNGGPRAATPQANQAPGSTGSSRAAGGTTQASRSAPGAGTWGAGGSAGGAGARHGGPEARGRPPVQRRGADGQVIEWRNAPDGTGGAGEPPGRPSGTVLPFGRFIAWSIGEVARYDPGYLDWLDQRPEGAAYRVEIDATLRRLGWRQRPGSSNDSWRDLARRRSP